MKVGLNIGVGRAKLLKVYSFTFRLQFYIYSILRIQTHF